MQYHILGTLNDGARNGSAYRIRGTSRTAIRRRRAGFHRRRPKPRTPSMQGGGGAILWTAYAVGKR